MNHKIARLYSVAQWILIFAKCSLAYKNCTGGGGPLGSTKIGDFCDRDSDCVAPDRSKCNFIDICVCIDPYIPSKNLDDCLGMCSRLGEVCEDPIQCTQGVPGPLSNCILSGSPAKKTFQCVEEAVNEPGQHICYKKAEFLHDSCIVHSQCTATLGPLSECKYDLCYCTARGVGSVDRKRCLEIINTIGGECEELVQCTTGIPGEFSNCVRSNEDILKTVCNCTSRALHLPGEHKCYLKAQSIGDECENHPQCTAELGDLSECVGGSPGTKGKCDCEADATPNNDDDHCLLILHQIGDECEEDVQCKGGTPGPLSDCIRLPGIPRKTICNCTDLAVHDLDTHECFPRARSVGDGCNFQRQCDFDIGDHVICQDEKCLCIPGFTESSDGSNCLLGDVLIGDKCTDKNQCVGNPGVTSECSSTGECACVSTHVSSRDRKNCLRIATGLDDECTERQQCQQGPPGIHSDCFEKDDGSKDSTCKCIPEAVTEPSEDVCYKKATLVGDECVKNVQCTPNLGNSHCLDKTCDCLDKSVPSTDRSRCLQMLDLREVCEDDTQCEHRYASCQAKEDDDGDEINVCDCITGFINPPDGPEFCIPLAAKIGTSCDFSDEQCSDLQDARPVKCMQDAESKNKTCECQNQEDVVGADEKRCLQKVSLGETCFEDVQCNSLVEGSECAVIPGLPPLYKCMCKGPEYVKSEIREICKLVVLQLREPCDENVQCTAGMGAATQCRGGECICASGYTEFSGTCYRPAQLHSPCTISAECHLGTGNQLSECVGTPGRCLCSAGSAEYQYSCYEVKSLGEPCDNDYQCRLGGGGSISICRDGYCKCMENNVEHEKKCYPPASLYARCSTIEECLIGAGNNTVCVGNPSRCECEQDAVEYKYSCYLRRYIGDTCYDDRECQATIYGEVECHTRSNTCECKIGYYAEMDNIVCAGVSHLKSLLLLIVFSKLSLNILS